MTDFTVHRFRFGNWMPSAVKALTVDQLYSNKVAVGREDGDIEILAPADSFTVQAKVHGTQDFKLQSLAWSTMKEEAGRLFGVSLKGFLFEVDLTTCTFTNMQDTYSGAAWCMAASPRANILAIGGEDGIVRLFRYYNQTRLEYVKSLPTSGARVLSIAYHPVKAELFIGCSDGTIRCLDEETGRTLFRMTGDVHPGVFTPCIWSLAVLSDSTVITGDSRGQVQFWDGNVGVLTGSFVHHIADILSIVASPTENAIFASGIDGKVVCIQRSVEENMRSTWVYAHSHRPHTHDVYAMAIISKPKKQSIPGKNWTLLSGGLDAKISMYAADDFDRIRPVWMPIIPANELISHSNTYHRIALRHRQHIDLWHLRLQEGITSSSGPIHDQCQLFLRLKASNSEHLHAASLAPNGQLLITSTASETKAWKIVYNPDVSNKVKLLKMNLPEVLQGKRGSIRHITFHPDGSMFAAWNHQKKQIYLFEIQVNGEEDLEASHSVDSMKLMASFPYEPKIDEETSSLSVVDKKLSHGIKRMVFSPDGKYIAIANHAREVTIFNMKKRSKHWTIPEVAATIADIQFLNEKKAHNLSILLANNALLIFDCDNMRLHLWSAAVDQNKQKSIPHELKFSLAGVSTDPNQSSRLFVYGQLQSIHIDLNEEIPQRPKVILPYYALNKNTVAATAAGKESASRRVTFSSETKGTKRKIDALEQDIDEDDTDNEEEENQIAESTSANLALIETYRNILHLGLLGDNKMVVIENPWARITEGLPDTIARKRYGT